MRRTNISPEFTYVGQYGTKNMMEETSFFGSKMLSIEDYISITNNNIVYYQSSSSEQLNYSLEKNLQPIVYSSVSSKGENHTITIDPNQSTTQKSYNTKWNIIIDIKSILSEYIFSVLKSNRTFQGVTNTMTSFNNIDAAINDYISKNILNRYQYSKIDFFIEYESFVQNGTLRYNNSFIEITNSQYLTNQIQPVLSNSQDALNITFNQSNDSSLYNFNYYFNIYFERI